MAQILADELGIPLDWISVFHGTTSFVAEGYGTYHSRAVVVGGSAVKVAAAGAGRAGRALAARRAGVDPDALALARRRGPSARPQRRGPRADARGRSPPRARPRPRRRSRPSAGSRPGEAHLHLRRARRPRGGRSRDRAASRCCASWRWRTWAARSIPLLVHGQAHRRGGAGAGRRVPRASSCTTRPASSSRARSPTTRCRPPTAFPHIDAITLEEAPSTLNPLGAKGAGEGGIVAVGAAAANAVAAALAPLGVVVRDAAAVAREHRRAGIRAARQAGPMPIDVHAHYVPRGLVETLAARGRALRHLARRDGARAATPALRRTGSRCGRSSRSSSRSRERTPGEHGRPPASIASCCRRGATCSATGCPPSRARPGIGC